MTAMIDGDRVAKCAGRLPIPDAYRYLPVGLMLACLAGPLPANAQTTDLAKATCANFLTLSNSEQAQLSLWLAGFYAGNAQRPVIDPARTSAAPAALAELCQKTPDVALIGAETRALFLSPPNQ